MNKPPCYHCLEPVPAGVSLTVSFSGAEQPVCCIGCKMAAEFISNAGLGQFYQHRDTPVAAGLRPEQRNYARYDKADVAEQLVVTRENGEREATLQIGNLYCSACIWLLDNVIGNIDGILDFSANPASHRAVVRWNADEVAFSTILTRIATLGFEPTPLAPGIKEQTDNRDSQHSLRRLVVAALFGMQAMMFAIALYAGEFQGMSVGVASLLRYASLLVSLPIMAYAAVPFFVGAIRGVKGRKPGMDVPVSLALVIAFAASLYATLSGSGAIYFDSIAMFVLFLSISRHLEMRARHRADDRAQVLGSLLPASVTRITQDRDDEEVGLSQVRQGDLIRLRPGDTVPVDGTIEEGCFAVDESFLTGESRGRQRRDGERLLAGSSCLSGSGLLRVEKAGASTELAEIGRLIEKAQADRSPLQLLTDRIATRFVVGVLLIATISALFWWFRDAERTLPIVLSVLIVSCPCALALATPAALAAAANRLSRRGVLLVRGRLLDVFRPGATLVFDKTGTLTAGQPQVTEARRLTGAGTLGTEFLLSIAAELERASEHVISHAFAPFRSDGGTYDSSIAVPVLGQGVSGVIDGTEYRIGQLDFVSALSEDNVPASLDRDAIFLGSRSGLLAWFRISDPLRSDAKASVSALRDAGFRIVIASGDGQENVSAIAASLDVDDWHARMRPEDKLTLIERLEQETPCIMIGDGMNDAPVLAAASGSLALDAGTALARASADAIVPGSQLSAVVDLAEIARQTRAVIRQNAFWAIGYNIAGVSLAMAGVLAPWMAAIGMSLSSLLVVVNAMRLNRKHSVKPGRQLTRLAEVGPVNL